MFSLLDLCFTRNSEGWICSSWCMNMTVWLYVFIVLKIYSESLSLRCHCQELLGNRAVGTNYLRRLSFELVTANYQRVFSAKKWLEFFLFFEDIYCALVKSKLKYGSVVWFLYASRNINIPSLENRCFFYVSILRKAPYMNFYSAETGR